ncbi:ThuA domain-containing protein [Actinopolymorpha rutila]|uniref:ThuA-like domain-containing protein n=1 Tax=Actinopolymorpha rutila TaxID=446787 RepID=A0A852Z4N3_9ACTN|nr:ThuA domain-containing protein [Actinopolymorpha rutila]NYH87791.1 hypothetical protein [Actinopolymorpha rutila]
MTRLLVFSRTAGYRHESIEAGVAALRNLAADASVDLDHTESGDAFTSANLSGYAAVVWLQTSGTGLLDAAQRQAYEEFTASGGGYAGIHVASDAERDWPLFDRLVGARFTSHPRELQTARIQVERTDDPSTRPLPTPWSWHEEWYAFDTNPRGTVDVLATVNEDDYDAGSSGMGPDHPICWRTQVGRAKAWYTSLGHAPVAYEDETFRAHLWGGITSVLR